MSSWQVGVGDVVVTVDGTPVGGDVKYAKQLFLGDPETGVTLGLKRNGTGKNLYVE
jgi:C-terminal processing protease CtpA/Prc